MSAESLLPWQLIHKNPDGSIEANANIGVAQADYRDIVMVAGEDPYAYKGIDDFASPHVRVSGEGGCGNADKNTKKSGDGVTNPPKETS
jgi:phytanoyl-CoA hydroxylase